MTSLIHAFFSFFCGHLGEGQSQEGAGTAQEDWRAQGRTEELGGETKGEMQVIRLEGKSLKTKCTAGCFKVVGKMLLGNLSRNRTGANLEWKLENRDSGSNCG